MNGRRLEDVTEARISDEAKGTLGAVAGVLLFVLALVALMVLVAGCVGPTKLEYQSFVSASRAFYNDVAPLASEALAGPAYQDDTGKQIKRNHEGELRDYGLALEQAEARAAGK